MSARVKEGINKKKVQPRKVPLLGFLLLSFLMFGVYGEKQ